MSCELIIVFICYKCLCSENAVQSYSFFRSFGNKESPFFIDNEYFCDAEASEKGLLHALTPWHQQPKEYVDQRAAECRADSEKDISHTHCHWVDAEIFGDAATNTGYHAVGG
jgi:hypothetical protein